MYQGLNGYSPEQLQQDFLRAALKPMFSEIYYADARTGLVILKPDNAQALIVNLSADRKLMEAMFGLIPKPFIERAYYAVFPQGDRLGFALSGILHFEQHRNTKDYIPTRLDLRGEGTCPETINNKAVIPETFISILATDKGMRWSTINGLAYADVGNKRALALHYNQSGELLACFVNGEFHSATQVCINSKLEEILWLQEF